jgi:hypothetical protein
MADVKRAASCKTFEVFLLHFYFGGQVNCDNAELYSALSQNKKETLF